MGCHCRRLYSRYILVLIFAVLLGACWNIYFITRKQNTIQQMWTHRGHSVPSEIQLYQWQQLQQIVPVRLKHNYIPDGRKTIMDTECRTKSSYQLSDNRTLIYNKAYNFMYCQVPKVGSTFWIRFIHQVRTKKMASPFNIQPQFVNDLKVKDMWDNINVTLKNSTKFLFVRNPYRRLLSGYIDKLYSPNPYFWSHLGKYIVKNFRNKSGSLCGHDVTFHEFLQYAVRSETTREHQNNHFMSFWQLCSPCHVDYNVIGKMETFQDDTNHILDKLHLERYKDELRNMSVDAVSDALYDTAQAYTTMRAAASNCISPRAAADRIWTKLKVRGFIAANLPVPIGIANRNETELFKLFKDANSKSILKLGSRGLKQQQNAFFLQAFRRIPPQIIKEIKEAYHMDFTIFGYDKEFENIHNKSDNFDVFISNIVF